MVLLSHIENDNHNESGGRISCPVNNRYTAIFDRRVDGATVLFQGAHVELASAEGDVAVLKLRRPLLTSTSRIRNGEFADTGLGFADAGDQFRSGTAGSVHGD
ncbi:hypothetical protein AB0M12_16055 [Nocardia vinacea]|uniref:hypothetical protein n=1 Tax=Nocardia vinacea TaxID=96468 RepID=UPI00344663B8